MAKHTREEWKGYLEGQKNSRKTQAVYCQENGLKLSAFRYWKNRQDEDKHNYPATLVEVPLRFKDHESGSIKVIFPNGCSLQAQGIHEATRLIDLAKAIYRL